MIAVVSILTNVVCSDHSAACYLVAPAASPQDPLPLFPQCHLLSPVRQKPCLCCSESSNACYLSLPELHSVQLPSALLPAVGSLLLLSKSARNG